MLQKGNDVMNSGQLSVSVLVSCEHHRNHLNKLVEDLLQQDYPSELLEIILIGIEEYEEGDTYFQYYASEYQQVEYVRSSGKNVPREINQGIQQSRGEILIILENNVRCYNDLVSKVVEKFKDISVDCLIGNSLPAVSNDGILQLAMMECLSSWFCNHDSSKHYAISTKERFSFPFGCFRKSCFTSAGYFSEDLHEWYCEDFIERLTRQEAVVEICPDVKIIRYIPETLSDLSARVLRKSLFRPLFDRMNSKAHSYRNKLAPLFVFCLIVSWIGGLYHQVFLEIFFGILLIHVILGVFHSISSYRHHRKIALFAIMPYVYFIIHGSSGWGYIVGKMRFWFWFRTTSNKQTTTGS